MSSTFLSLSIKDWVEDSVKSLAPETFQNLCRISSCERDGIIRGIDETWGNGHPKGPAATLQIFRNRQQKRMAGCIKTWCDAPRPYQAGRE